VIFNQIGNFTRKYKLSKEYRELLFLSGRGGGEAWAEYIIEIYPRDQLEIKVELIDKAVKYKEYYRTFEVGINKSITATLNDLNTRGIMLLGCDMIITNLSYHPVDSKPLAYQILFKEMINRLFNSDNFQMELDNTKTESAFYNITTVKYDKLQEYYLLKETHYQIVSPRIFKNTIFLNERVEILIKDLEQNTATWKITLSPKENSAREIYKLNIEFRDKFYNSRKSNMMSTFINVLGQLTKICQELTNRKFNLSGLYILVEPLYNIEEDPFVNSNISYLKWPLLDLLLDRNRIEIQKENL
jgi:hypothetical protein